jgi:hypothetical protein
MDVNIEARLAVLRSSKRPPAARTGPDSKPLTSNSWQVKTASVPLGVRAQREEVPAAGRRRIADDGEEAIRGGLNF